MTEPVSLHVAHTLPCSSLLLGMILENGNVIECAML